MIRCNMFAVSLEGSCRMNDRSNGPAAWPQSRFTQLTASAHDNESARAHPTGCTFRVEPAAHHNAFTSRRKRGHILALRVLLNSA